MNELDADYSNDHRNGGDRRRRYSRSRSPVQHSKRDNYQRSRSPSPKYVPLSMLFFHFQTLIMFVSSLGRAVIELHRVIDHLINNQLTLFIGKRRATLTLRRTYRVRRFRYEENDD